jgi:hypothetical protein
MKELPLKMSAGRYRRFTPHNGHSAMIHVSGSVSTGAGMFSPQPLQETVWSQRWEFHHLCEHKANMNMMTLGRYCEWCFSIE